MGWNRVSAVSYTHLLKETARKMAEEHGLLRKFEMFERVEKLSQDVFAKVKNDQKVISANVDFYSGLVYVMLGIPSDLYTPMFACLLYTSFWMGKTCNCQTIHSVSC